MFPVETLIEKYKEQDYNFFLSHKNFLKVADSLEKFESHLDLSAPESKDFIIFKRKLYMAYEVRNRSTLEHTAISSNVSAKEIYHMRDSINYHVSEM